MAGHGVAVGPGEQIATLGGELLLPPSQPDPMRGQDLVGRLQVLLHPLLGAHGRCLFSRGITAGHQDA